MEYHQYGDTLLINQYLEVLFNFFFSSPVISGALLQGFECNIFALQQNSQNNLSQTFIHSLCLHVVERQNYFAHPLPSAEKEIH